VKVLVKTCRESDIAAVMALHSRTEPLRSGEDSHVVIADLAQDEIDTLRENAYELDTTSPPPKLPSWPQPPGGETHHCLPRRRAQFAEVYRLEIGWFLRY
jgi:hypothetical protein